MTNRTARRVKRCGLALLLLGILCAGNDRSEVAGNATTLSATEAEILVYVSPVGQRERNSGLDVAMELQTSAQLDQNDYYYFWVYNAKREQSRGSVTIGYYAVNKHTAEVWDTGARKQISSKLMLGVQEILRESHHIDKRTMEKYSGKPF